MKYIVANWKSQKSTMDGKRWLEKFASLYHPDERLSVVLAPTLVSLESLAKYVDELKLKNFSLAAQDVSPFPRGNYTGAVAADLLKGLARFALVGHAERKRYFHETMQDILNKAAEASEAGLVPLICVDDASTLSSLSALAELEGEFFLVYTPYDPVVSGNPEPIGKVSEMMARMHRSFPQAKLLYGGAVQPDNCAEYMELDTVSGLFVGGASLDAVLFAGICKKVF